MEMHFVFLRVLASLCIRVLCVVLCLAISGCSGTIHPPAHPADPVPIYVTDYGRHSSIVLPDAHGAYTEWAFGDWNWFALGHTQWYDAIVPIFISPQSTLAQRTIAANTNDDALRRELGANTLLRFDVPAPCAQQLEEHLTQRYLRHINTQMHSDYSQMDHVKDSEIYSGLNDCNDLTARWLRDMGCEVDGLTTFSKFKLGPPR
jgi:hypothetical protein